jgi:hypothetical protein
MHRWHILALHLYRTWGSPIPFVWRRDDDDVEEEEGPGNAQ